ncbi:helix-turn-helix domain-containing protein [Listeria newyorkensis]|uniref:helix-turn-helix domain-containing protein n=1 Tax=Listeria newyorkensis TaxID=1497681 RepID=UPI00051CDD21|nr:helix-turn-helix transcriptional regulator [Listeria newyorkensis]KGL43645.1 hypothetical protein EP58_07875 [Listeria newyorkensis]
MDLKQYGKTIKMIRENLNISRKQLYDGVMVKSNAQRFEKGEQDSSFEKVSILLDRLELSFDEFIYIHHKYKEPERERFLHDFVNLKDTTNTTGIMDLHHKITRAGVADDTSLLGRLRIVLEAFELYNKDQHFENAKQLVEPIWKQLEQKDTWYYNDILIMANIYYVLEDEAVVTNITKMLKQIKKYAGYKNSVNLDTVILLNYCVYLSKRGRVLETEPYVQRALENAKKYKQTDYLIQAKMKLAELLWAQGKKTEATEIAEKMFMVLENLDRLELLKDFKQDWEKITSENRD